MIDDIKLSVLDLLSFIFKNMGVDYPKMRLIVESKLKMDQRREYIGYQSNLSKKDRSYTILLLMHIMLGTLMAIFIALIDDIFIAMSISFSFYLFVFFLTIISNYSSVILDTRDMDIISTAPLSKKTIGAAKLMHIVLFVFILALFMGIPSMIAGFIKYGAAFVFMLFLSAILISMLTVSVSNYLYFVILNAFDGEALKNIISYFQIVLTIIVFLSYHLFGRIIGILIENIDFSLKAWHMILPPIWYSSAYKIIFNGDKDIFYFIAAFIGIAFPILSILYLLKRWDLFELNLVKLQSSNTELSDKSILKSLGKVFTRSGVENKSYNLSLNIIGRDRALKTKLIPSLALIVIFPIILSINNGAMDNLFIYISGWIVFSLLLNIFDILKLSENFEASWIFLNHDKSKREKITSGICKAFFIKYITPTFILANINIMIMSNQFSIKDMAIQYLILMALMPLTYKISVRIPFSINAKNLNETSSSLAGFVTKVILSAILGILYYNHIYKNNSSYAIALVIVLILNILSIIFGFRLFKSGDGLLTDN
ncbi:MAG: hypothetical protein Q4P34_03980 [Tissierellia bacterium]|nr:hypothetical protein [Tissierellia bacterium]